MGEEGEGVSWWDGAVLYHTFPALYLRYSIRLSTEDMSMMENSTSTVPYSDWHAQEWVCVCCRWYESV